MAQLVVVGGGIGGLATALAAARHGHRSVVLERSKRFAELGAGIQLAPNGIHALNRLGVGRPLQDCAVHIDELRFMDGITEEHVVSLPFTEDYRRRFGNPYVVVHRGELYTVLLAACQDSDLIELRAGNTVTSYEQDATGATVVLDSGARLTGDGVIGADGIHSALRQHMLADGEPRISGIVVYRDIVPIERVPEELRWNAVTWWAGPKCHLVHYPIANGTYLNLAGSRDNDTTEAFAGVPVQRADVYREFTPLGATAHRLLELGRNWKSWVLVDRDPVPNWTDGRVTLLGDAAHPMLHYVAQGACQALEDAVVLGDLLDCSAAELPQRFEKYNAQRQERTAQVQRLARDSIALWHAAGDRAVARNAALSAMSATDLHDYVEWMHGARGFGADTPGP